MMKKESLENVTLMGYTQDPSDRGKAVPLNC